MARYLRGGAYLKRLWTISKMKQSQAREEEEGLRQRLVTHHPPFLGALNKGSSRRPREGSGASLCAAGMAKARDAFRSQCAEGKAEGSGCFPHPTGGRSSPKAA